MMFGWIEFGLVLGLGLGLGFWLLFLSVGIDRQAGRQTLIVGSPFRDPFICGPSTPLLERVFL